MAVQKTFFIFGWCAAEMRRIIDVSLAAGHSIDIILDHVLYGILPQPPAVSCLQRASLIWSGSSVRFCGAFSRRCEGA